MLKCVKFLVWACGQPGQCGAGAGVSPAVRRGWARPELSSEHQQTRLETEPLISAHTNLPWYKQNNFQNWLFRHNPVIVMSVKEGKEQINCFSAMDKLATCASRLLRGSRSTPGFCSQNIEVSQINRREGHCPGQGRARPGAGSRIHLI